uniref:NADH-ubiquinone oxidoreductase chain 4L n=1 Tax=Echinolaelaps traubi TaxID=3119979 RepID=A0AAU6PBD7_9ACAR
MFSIISYIFLLFSVGMLSFIFNSKHILSILLSMEIMVLGIFLLMFSFFYMNSIFELIMFYLILVVCESCLGLSILILLINFYGSDLINSLNILNN